MVVFDLPMLGSVQDNSFIAFDTVTLQMFMGFPVSSWNDFIIEDQLQLMNLKCMLPSGYLVSGQVTIVKELDTHWPPDWWESMWVDERRCFYFEHMMERYSMYGA